MSIITNLHKALEPDLTAVNRLIVSYLATDENMIESIGKYLLESGGKRIRPILTLLSSKMCGYEGDNDIKLATAVEFIHVATLLHDDVVDGSNTRRFKPTANMVWGNKASILVGDFLFSRSFELMVATESIEALKVLSKTAGTIVKGEVSQLTKLNQQRIISRNEYNSIIFAKTAELFGAACEVGAILAGKSKEVCAALRRFGNNLGLIFQIKDDLLDYFGKEEETGKNTANDFLEGKVTLPLILLHEKLPDEEKTQLTKSLKGTRDLEGFGKVLKQMRQYQTHEQITHNLNEFKQEAERLLENVGMENIYKDHLLSLLDFAMTRSY